MGMLNSLSLAFIFFSHITQASFSEFVIDGHHYTSPNQQKPPPTLSISESQSLPDNVSPTELRKRVWAAHNLPYLPFILNSPFYGTMTSRFATPVGQIPLEKGVDTIFLKVLPSLGKPSNRLCVRSVLSFIPLF